MPHLLKALEALGTLRRADAKSNASTAPRTNSQSPSLPAVQKSPALALHLTPDRKGFVALRLQFLADDAASH